MTPEDPLRLSPELQAAQARLQQLRAERDANQGIGRPPANGDASALPASDGGSSAHPAVDRPSFTGCAYGPLARTSAPHPDGLHSVPSVGFNALNYANQPDLSAAPPGDDLSSRSDTEAQRISPSSPASLRPRAIIHPRAEAQGRGEEEDVPSFPRVSASLRDNLPPACAPPTHNWPLINAQKELHQRRAVAIASGAIPSPMPKDASARPLSSPAGNTCGLPADTHPDEAYVRLLPGLKLLNYANLPDLPVATFNEILSSSRDAEGQEPFPSSPASQRLRAIIYPRAEAQWREEEPLFPCASASPRENLPLPAATIPVHPTLLLAILRHNQAAPARVWLLLRHIDAAGRGRLDLDDVRRRLTDPGSPLRCCGPRRLRQILAEGEGLFWRRDDRDRLWLIAAHKVAHALDSGPMQGAPVELPVAALLGGIQSVRAAFYAAFHSGRKESPISRDTLETISGIAARTQLEYDRAAGVGRRRNVAVGERYSAERHQSRAWERGRAAFRFIDTAGRQGRPGGEYVAWHLPNSYEGPYARRATIGRKRLNRKLADLVIKGTPGNDGHAAERVFWPDGAAAARSYNRGLDHDAYWHAAPAPARPVVWHVMARQPVARQPVARQSVARQQPIATRQDEASQAPSPDKPAQAPRPAASIIRKAGGR